MSSNSDDRLDPRLLYRTLPGPMVAQGSSVLYMLNQLGAALGVALVTLLVQMAGDPMAGFRGVAWFAFAVIVIVIVLAAVPLLPGRPRTPAEQHVSDQLTRTS